MYLDTTLSKTINDIVIRNVFNDGNAGKTVEHLRKEIAEAITKAMEKAQPLRHYCVQNNRGVFLVYVWRESDVDDFEEFTDNLTKQGVYWLGH